MREIKFRGQRVDNKEWVYGYYFIDERDIEDGFIWRDIPQIQERYGDHYKYHDVIPETVGQFTGLTDKNGKEIYEGDIIECWSQGIKATGRVQQRIDGLWIIYPAFQNWQFWGLCPDRNGTTQVEIIGNIHNDNPELLEVYTNE